MKIVSAKCPNCGGILEVDSEKDAAICRYCQSPFIVEKAIQNFNITNHYTTVNQTVNNVVNNISGQEVHIHNDGESPEQLLENIKALLGRKEYRLAEKTREKLKEKYPADYRVDESEVLLMLNGYSAGRKWRPEAVSGYDDLICNRVELVTVYYFLYALDKLKKSNAEAYQVYYNGLLDAANKKLSKDFGREITGYALVSKLTADEWCDLSKEFVALDKACGPASVGGGTYGFNTEFDEARVSIDAMNRMLALRANDMRRNRYSLCIDEFGNYVDYGKGISIEDDGTDDDYLICMISEANKNLFKLNAWPPKCGTNNFRQTEVDARYKKSKQCLTEFIDAATARLSNEGKQKYRRIKGEKRRNEIKTFWEGYAKYLSAGMYRDAYNLLVSNGAVKGVMEELAKFKKGLFGVKYNGNVTAFNADTAIKNSLGAEGL